MLLLLILSVMLRLVLVLSQGKLEPLPEAFMKFREEHEQSSTAARAAAKELSMRRLLQLVHLSYSRDGFITFSVSLKEIPNA